jgi:cell division protein FtsI (penicillin-binding protein 3)
MEPILIRRVETATGELVREAIPRVRRRAVSTRVARTIAEMMVGVTEGEGTGVEAAIDGYEVAGKTATAQKADPKSGLYSLDKYVASFVGFVPAKNPVVAIAVLVDEPMVEHAGGAVAAPVFRRVAEMALKYYGLTPKGTKSADIGELARRPDPANAAYEQWRIARGKLPAVQEIAGTGRTAKGSVRLPDMTGWSLRKALKQVKELGVVPRVRGTGLLARQQPPPGEIVGEGAPVLLVFEPAT